MVTPASHDLDEALKLGSRIAIMKDGKIIQYSVPEEIVLNPADDYVRTFVAHTNPLNVLCGRSLMRTLDNCKRVNGSVCLDPGGDSWLDLAEGNTIKGARQNGAVMNLQNWAPGQAVEGLGRWCWRGCRSRWCWRKWCWRFGGLCQWRNQYRINHSQWWRCWSRWKCF